jgi:hypothetical protein
MATATKKKTDTSAILALWERDVADIVDQVGDWLESHPAKPVVRRGVTTISEPELGQYEAPTLDAVFNGEVRDAVTVEPIARNYPGRGSVEVISWPKLRRVYLRKSSDQPWVVYTESNIPLHQEWNEVNFHRLVDDLRVDL